MMFKAKHFTVLLAATALSTLAIQPANAQSVDELKAQLESLSKRIEELEKKKAKAPVVKKEEPAFALGTDDGMFEFNLRGRIYADAGWVSDEDGNEDTKATEFRTARLGIEGKAWKKVKYKFEADFADNEVDVKDAFIQYQSDMGDWTMGQFKTPNSLEEQTSSRHITFMERASFTDAFELARMIGVGYGNGGDTWTFNAGVFRGGNAVATENEGYAVAARATYGGEFKNGVWMLGASARFQDIGDGDLIRYRQRPHNHLAQRYVATPRLSEEDTMYGIEAAVQAGSFHMGAEWASLTAKDGGTLGRNATFTGGYVEAGWFITGESKPLKLKDGTWDRPKVKNPLHEGGMGAWQIAAKYDVIDLTDNGVFGGEQDTWIVGLNWYLNRHTRLMANYSNSSISEAFAVGANGADGENSVDTFAMRFQVDW